MITPRTRAVINVAYGGHPGEAVALRELCDSRDLILIEDAAHALGAETGGRAAGAIGHVGAFSFFANKNLPLGEGGMAVAEDPDLAARMRLLRSHGVTADTWARHRGLATEYDVLEPGFNFRLDEPRAALGIRLLGRLAADNEHRARVAREYLAALGGLEGVEAAIKPAVGVRSAWHIFPVLLDSRAARDAFRESLHTARIQTSVHYPALHLTTAFAGYAQAPLPRTEAYAQRTATLPLFPHMSAAQQARVIETVAEAVARLTGRGAAASPAP